MAALVLSIAGAAAGSAVLGPVGAIIGRHARDHDSLRDVAALNAKIDGLGNALQGIAASAQAPAVAAVTAAVNAAPKAGA
jgi:hypothetical protein